MLLTLCQKYGNKTKMIDLITYEKFPNQKTVTKERLENEVKNLGIEIKDHQDHLVHLEEALDMEQVRLVQIARQVSTVHATIVGKFSLLSGGVARERLEITEDESRQTTILQLTMYDRPGSQNHLESELPRQFEKYNQVLGRISNSQKIEVFSFVLVDIPRHCRRDDAKPGPLDSFEADGPVPLIDSEVVHFNRERLICLFADRELVSDYA